MSAFKLRLPQHPLCARLVVFLTLALTLSGCRIFAGKPAKVTENEVLVMGTLHAGHLTSETYGLAELEKLLRDVNPTLVICEIPPDRFVEAWQEFVLTGETTEERVVLYPEFTEVLFPMALEGRIRVEPCSAWTAPMAKRRTELIAQWQTSRPRDSREVDTAQLKAQRKLSELGIDEDPLLLHTARYDRIVAEGMEPYERLFSRDLGNGGWTQINLAHASLIEAELDAWSGDGIRVVVLFGAGHKYRLIELLSQREDIRMISLEQALAPPS